MSSERQRIRWVVFDFGGTLAHSIPSFPGFIARHLFDFGYDRSVPAIEGLIERMQAEPWMQAKRHNSDEEDRAFWSQFYERISVLLGIPRTRVSRVVSAMVTSHYAIDSFCLYPDTVPALAKFQSIRLPIAVASNFDSSLRKRLQYLGLSPFVHSAVISAEIGASKPSREFYIRLLDELNAYPSQLLFVGNSITDDIEPAAAIGIQTVWIDRAQNGSRGIPSVGKLTELGIICSEAESRT